MNLFVAENLISSGSNSQEFVSHKINLQVDKAWLVLYLNRAKPILFQSFSLGIFFFFFFFNMNFFFHLFLFIGGSLLYNIVVVFCHTLTLMSHGFTCVPHPSGSSQCTSPEHPSHVPSSLQNGCSISVQNPVKKERAKVEEVIVTNFVHFKRFFPQVPSRVLFSRLLV